MHNLRSSRSYPRARADLTFRPVNGHFALADRTGATAQTLNLTAALVWTYCDGRNDPAAIAGALASHLSESADPSELQARVRSLLEEFARQGILS